METKAAQAVPHSVVDGLHESSVLCHVVALKGSRAARSSWCDTRACCYPKPVTTVPHPPAELLIALTTTPDMAGSNWSSTTLTTR